MKNRKGINLFVVGHQPSAKDISNQFVNDISQFFAVDKLDNFLTRIEELLELTQTSIVYFIVSLFLGILIDKIIPDFEEGEPLHKTISLLCFQIILNSFGVFYMEKIIRSIPFVFHFYHKYKPQSSLQTRVGEAVAISLVFFVTQDDLINRISYLKRHILGKSKA